MQSLQLSEASVIFDYLKQNCLTQFIEYGVLKKISEVVAKSLYNRTEIEMSIKKLNLPIGQLQIQDVAHVLQFCVKDKAPMISKVQNISEEKDNQWYFQKHSKKVKADTLIFSPIDKISMNFIQLNESDYREEAPIIRNRIIQQQQEDWKEYDKEVEEYGKNCAKASYDGPLPESPAKPLPNFLGIVSPKYPLIQVEEESFHDKKNAIKTGDLIHDVLKKNKLEAFYFKEFKKIIVLSSSNISPEELRLIFEKYYFKTGMYPVVENERTKFGDLMIHISDKLPSLIQPLFFPSETQIFDYLSKDKIVDTYISVDVLQFIAKKLDMKQYIPQETLKNLESFSMSSEISLKPFEISILDTALMRCAKDLPPRK